MNKCKAFENQKPYTSRCQSIILKLEGAKLITMTRQDMMEDINNLLPKQPQEKLEALLGWLKQDDDTFEKNLRSDVDAGKFDELIASVIAEDSAQKKSKQY